MTTLSEQIIEFIKEHEGALGEYREHSKSLHDLESDIHPIPDIQDMRSIDRSGSARDSIREWERLEEVWNSCKSSDLFERYRRLYAYIREHGISEHIKGQIDEHFQHANDSGRLSRILSRKQELEEKFQQLEKRGKQLEGRLNEYTDGLSFHFEFYPNRQGWFNTAAPYDVEANLNLKVKLSFREQDLGTLALEILQSCRDVGLKRYEIPVWAFTGTNKAGVYGQINEELTEDLTFNYDVSEVQRLRLIARTHKTQSESELSGERSIVIDLSKQDNGRIGSPVLLNYQREVDGKFYIEEVGEIIDHLANRYRARTDTHLVNDISNA